MYMVEEIGSKHIEDLLPLARSFHSEHNPSVEFDDAAVRESVLRASSDFDRPYVNGWIVYAVKGEDRIPVGFLVGHCNRYFFNYSYCATQELWYIRPDYRGSKAAFALLKAFEEWARLRGAKQIFCGVVTTNDKFMGRFSNMMTKIGYPLVGYFFRKETVK